MPLSYEFEGHYLPDWAEFGGLPVWNCHAEEEKEFFVPLSLSLFDTRAIEVLIDTN